MFFPCICLYVAQEKGLIIETMACNAISLDSPDSARYVPYRVATTACREVIAKLLTTVKQDGINNFMSHHQTISQ